MKKSEIYRITQIAVVGNENISTEAKLEILKELMDAEKWAAFGEEREAKATQAVAE